MTGAPASREVQTAAWAAWFDVSMRWVLITAFGVPVDPDVKSSRATVSGPMEWNADETAEDASG